MLVISWLINSLSIKFIVFNLIFLVIVYLYVSYVFKKKNAEYDRLKNMHMQDYTKQLADLVVSSLRQPAIFIVNENNFISTNQAFIEMIHPLSVEEYLEKDFYVQNFFNNKYEHRSYDIELNNRNYYAGFDCLVSPYLNGVIITYVDVSYIKDFYIKQDIFINDLKHEVKTPITAIAGLSDVLLNRTDLSNEEKNKILMTIREEIYRLNDLISRLTTVIDQKVNFQQINLDDVFEELSILYHGKDLAIPVYFSNFVDEEIYTDKKILKQIIINLVDNGVKFTSYGFVKVSSLIEDDKIKIAIVDTGAGIAKSEQEQIFERFYRKNKFDDRQVSGYGLGLNIVNDLLKKINGKISVKSKVNEGTTFTIELPITEESK